MPPVRRWLLGLLRLWGDEVRVAVSGRRHLTRRILLVGLLQVVGLRLLVPVVPGFQVDGWGSAVLAVAAIALLNAGLWPILLYLTLPLTVLTFGLFSVLLNALLLQVASDVVPGLAVHGTGAALWAGTGLAVINAFVSLVFDVSDDESFSRQILARAVRRRGAVTAGAAGPGLVVLQIDGLSVDVLRLALRTGLMPTLARWVRSGSHRLVGWECALPSQTSASQAGILYGNNFDIPAFRWYEKDSSRLMVSNRPEDAATLSQRLSDGRGLLHQSGSSLSNLLDGDAERSVLTLSTLGSGARERLRSSDFFAYFLDPYAVPRTVVLMVWEMVLEVWQARRQRLRDVQPRVARGGSFPFLRAVSCVLLRDITTTLIVEDLQRGVPMIYADYVAYDELAHHAGPERPESLAVLADLDRQIAACERAAQVAPRPYSLVVLSDHGQTQGAPFRQSYGQTLAEVVRALMGRETSVDASAGTQESWGHVNALLSEAIAIPSRIAGKTLTRLLHNRVRNGYVDLGPDRAGETAKAADVVVCASGNLGLVYFTGQTERLTREGIEMRYPDLIRRLADHAGIGLVLVRSRAEGALVLGRDGLRYLADDRVEGRDPLRHFGALAADHLRRLDSFPHVGDIVVISQIDPATGEVAPFEELVGSHGGLGGPQTNPFLLFPSEWDREEPPLVGAPSLYALLCRWRDRRDARLVPDAPATTVPVAVEILSHPSP